MSVEEVEKEDRVGDLNGFVVVCVRGVETSRHQGLVFRAQRGVDLGVAGGTDAPLARRQA